MKKINIISRGVDTRYSCIRCGKCCSSGPNVALTVFDVCRLARYLNKPWRDLAGKFFYVIIADYIPIAILRGLNDKCVFLKVEGMVTTCTVYPARPFRCRLYPFIPISPIESSKLEVSSRCPGVGRGDLTSPPWGDLDVYLDEVRKHYAELFQAIFRDGYEPIRALEATLDRVCARM